MLRLVGLFVNKVASIDSNKSGTGRLSSIVHSDSSQAETIKQDIVGSLMSNELMYDPTDATKYVMYDSVNNFNGITGAREITPLLSTMLKILSHDIATIERETNRLFNIVETKGVRTLKLKSDDELQLQGITQNDLLENNFYKNFISTDKDFLQTIGKMKPNILNS